MNQILFKKLGAAISEEENQKFVGISATKMWTYIKEKFNLPQSVEELIELERELKFTTLAAANLAPTDGVVNFLEFLKSNGNNIAIASSSFKKILTLFYKNYPWKNILT